MRRLYKILNNQKGSYSILIIIVAFIMIASITGMLDLIFKNYAIEEIQGVMDMAGVSCLKKAVDQTYLRMDKLKVEPAVAASWYITEVKKLIKPSGNSNAIIRYFDLNINDIDVTSGYSDSWGFDDNKPRQYAMIRVLARARVKASWYDKVEKLAKRYYDSKSNTTFTIEFVGVNNNGEAEIIIRSVSRIVFR